MNAKEMFEELGYKLVETGSIVFYKKEVEDDLPEHVEFGKNLKMYECYRSNFMRGVTYPKLVDANLHKAIHQQMIELGWLDG